MNIVKILLVPCAVVTLLLLTGCWFMGEGSIAHGTLVLSFPTARSQGKANLAVNDPEVQEALTIIDPTLASDGYVREASSETPNEPGVIADYAKYTSGGVRLPSWRRVILNDKGLEVEFFEYQGMHASPMRLSTATKTTMHSLRKELRNRYGRGRVKIQN